MTMRWRRCMADEALTALKAEIEAIHPAAAPPAMLAREECAVVAKPEWWNDEGLKVMSTRVMRLAPPDNAQAYNQMRALVLCGRSGAWEAVPRSTAELKEAATHDRAAALCPAPAVKAFWELAEEAGELRVRESARCV